MEQNKQNIHPLPADFLAQLLPELEHEEVRAIILRGSYARGDALPPYSDIDLTLIVYDGAEKHRPKRYIWRNGYAVSISTWSLSAYQERLQQPEEAIFAVPGIQEAQILSEKDDAFRSFQREILQFQWEPLQAAANTYAGQVLMDQTEIILKMLRAFHLNDLTLLAEVLILDLIPAVSEAFAVQQGILIKSGNTYFHQLQEVAGQDSVWTQHHQSAVGMENNPPLSLEQRAIAALRCFQETARLLHPHLSSKHWHAIGPLLTLIDQELSSKERG